MQVILNYKSFYEAVKIGVVNDGYTPVTRMLFFPVFDVNWGIQPCDADGVPYEVNNQNANSWCKGEEPIPAPVKTAVGKKTTLEALIKYYKSKDFTDQLYEATEDEMYEAVIYLVKNCDIPDSAKDKLLKVYNSGDHLAFLAHVFQRAIRGENKVVSKQRKKKAADKEADSVKEFNKLVRKKKPETVVPATVQPPELTYVTQLYAAYSTTGNGLNITKPEDLDALDFREHFEHQRKSFYMAETVHSETRDAVLPGERDPFEALKDEIEFGIFAEKRKTYQNAVDKVDAVVGKASELSISSMVDDATNHWIGVGEKAGVCHMLVNDERLKWVDI